ncbi:hypothetical protein CDAR_209451 [Caerostris darwini]|uniref:Uncharacterized protein n=1 Tax=Caerostris darwini TaxID=1538125 RepID=A0AAV4N7L2_9ARAC|nr:hypothetical protein CDAR_209451 [Caerostris darwini]
MQKRDPLINYVLKRGGKDSLKVVLCDTPRKFNFPRDRPLILSGGVGRNRFSKPIGRRGARARDHLILFPLFPNPAHGSLNPERGGRCQISMVMAVTECKVLSRIESLCIGNERQFRSSVVVS